MVEKVLGSCTQKIFGGSKVRSTRKRGDLVRLFAIVFGVPTDLLDDEIVWEVKRRFRCLQVTRLRKGVE